MTDEPFYTPNRLPRFKFNTRALGATLWSVLALALASTLIETFGMSPIGAVLIAAAIVGLCCWS